MKSNFLTALYRTDPDLAAALEKELLDIWLAEAVKQGHSWQSIEQLSQTARDREFTLQREEAATDENYRRQTE